MSIAGAAAVGLIALQPGLAEATPQALVVKADNASLVNGEWTRSSWYPVRNRYRAVYLRSPRRNGDIASLKVAMLEENSSIEKGILGIKFWVYRFDCRRDLYQPILLGFGVHATPAEHREVASRSLRGESGEKAIYVNEKPFRLLSNSNLDQELDAVDWRPVLPGSAASEELDAICARPGSGR